ncbi:MAG: hypothetical protein U0V70_09190 [Terriglobia bacterium]
METLREDIEEKYFTLEADTLPSPAGTRFITANDSPSNPQTRPAFSSLVSPFFDVDNVSPRSGSPLTKANQNGTMVVRFRGSDPYSPLRTPPGGQVRWEGLGDGFLRGRDRGLKIRIRNQDRKA